jgi:hypothetical protein
MNEGKAALYFENAIKPHNRFLGEKDETFVPKKKPFHFDNKPIHYSQDESPLLQIVVTST